MKFEKECSVQFAGLRKKPFERRQFLQGIGISAVALLGACGPEGKKAPEVQSQTPAGFAPLKTDIEKSGVPFIRPSPNWDGNAASGFGASYGGLPSDPKRTTAKPALRMITPPRQAYVDKLLVGFRAEANNGGTLINGVKKVRVHYEGNTLDIPSATFETFDDVNGKKVTYLAHWIYLARPTQLTPDFGIANLFAEAFPADPSMQNRVIGPYPFLPSAKLHDLTLTVRSDGEGDFTTLKAAAESARAQNAKNPLIRITQSGRYEFANVSGGYTPIGYCTIEASKRVSITNTDGLKFDAGGFVTLRPSVDYLCIRGSNITIDFAKFHELYITTPCWFDGCNITQSEGLYSLWRKSPRAVQGWLIRNQPYFTECEFSYTYNSIDKPKLARGNVLRDCWADVFNDPECVIGNHVENLDSRAYVNQIHALDIIYTGSAETATLEISSQKLLTVTYGATTETLQIQNTEAAFLASDRYNVQDIANWLSSKPGWSATMKDDSRAAWALGIDGGKGLGFPAKSVKDIVLPLYTSFDIHADWLQFSNNANLENILIADNTGFDLVAQDLFMPGMSLRDVLILNNAFHNKTDANSSIDLTSGMGGNRSHFVVAHNTLASQKFRIANARFLPDAYCLLANNSCRSILWKDGVNSTFSIFGNHVHGDQEINSAGTDSTSGGNHATLYAKAAKGDFAPAGELLMNLATPVLTYDLDGHARDSLAAKGAKQ